MCRGRQGLSGTRPLRILGRILRVPWTGWWYYVPACGVTTALGERGGTKKANLGGGGRRTGACTPHTHTHTANQGTSPHTIPTQPVLLLVTLATSLARGICRSIYIPTYDADVRLWLIHTWPTASTAELPPLSLQRPHGLGPRLSTAIVKRDSLGLYNQYICGQPPPCLVGARLQCACVYACVTRSESAGSPCFKYFRLFFPAGTAPAPNMHYSQLFVWMAAASTVHAMPPKPGHGHGAPKPGKDGKFSISAPGIKAEVCT